jgi:hypothetical protein
MAAAGRTRIALAALAVVVGAAPAVGLAIADDVALSRDADLEVVLPRDGAEVRPGFVLSWSPGRHRGSFAVVVDAALPRPGERVTPGPAVLVTSETALRLDLGPRVGGSPSARRHHEIVVVPLDDDGRRLGESIAVVHVRGRS